MHELLRRAKVIKEDNVFFDKVNLQIEFIKSHPIFEVTIKPVCLFDQEHTTYKNIFFEKNQHLIKNLTSDLDRILKLLITGFRLKCQTHSDSQRNQSQCHA